MDAINEQLAGAFLGHTRGETHYLTSVRAYNQFDPAHEAFQQIAARRAGQTVEDVQPRFNRVRDHEPEDGDDNIDEGYATASQASVVPAATAAADDSVERTPRARRFRDLINIPAEQPIAGEFTNAPADEAPSDSAFVAVKNNWLRLLEEQGYDALCQELLRDELNVRWPGSDTAGPTDQRWMAYFARLILASADRRIITGVINGNLALRRRQDPETAAVLDRLFEQSYKQPSIYMQQLVDPATGLSPTPNEIRTMCEWMEKYVDPGQNAFAHAVDNYYNNTAAARRAEAGPGFRSYMCTFQVDPMKKAGYTGKAKKPDHYSWAQSSDRVKQLRTFLRAVRKRLDELPRDKWDLPLEHPLVEFGYAEHSPSRLTQHSKHSSSNYLMNLMEAVARWLFDQRLLHKMYRIEQCVVYLIWQHPQAHLGEIVWTSLGEGYIHNGGGFSHYPAGRSNESVWKVPENVWERARNHVYSDSPILENMKIDEERMQRKVDTLSAQIDNLMNTAKGSSVVEKIRKLENERDNVKNKVGRYRREAEALLTGHGKDLFGRNMVLQHPVLSKLEQNKGIMAEAKGIMGDIKEDFGELITKK